MAGQLWSEDSKGGYMYSGELSDKLRHEVMPKVVYRQHCDAKDAMSKGLKTGQSFQWDVYSKIANQGGKISETEKMPESNFTIIQGSLTITEYGNSVPFTEKLDNLSKHSVEEVIDKVLKDDAAKAFDIDARAEFDKSKLRVVASAAGTDSASNLTFDTDGTPTGNNNAGLDKYHIKAIVDYMKDRNIPTYQGGDYFAIGRTTSFRTFKNQIEALHSYVDAGFRMIMNGEIGRYEGVRFIEQNNIASNAWTNSKSDTVHFFGNDTVAEAVVLPEEIRGKIPGDFGRDKGLAWYAMGGFGLVHTDALNSRIVVWDSAA